MIKCFLSHSSRDKDSYVRLVASRLRSEVKVFDEETFEAGMLTADEIARGLDESTLFVIFISDAALTSQTPHLRPAGFKMNWLARNRASTPARYSASIPLLLTAESGMMTNESRSGCGSR